MVLSATARRRVLGSLFLLAAMAMVVLGQTVLKERLQGLNFVFYWLVCVVLTGLAVLTALLDVRALQRRSRREQVDLLIATLGQVEKGTAKKRRRR